MSAPERRSHWVMGMLSLVLILATSQVSSSTPVMPTPPGGKSQALVPLKQPPTVTLTANRLAAFSGALLSTAPAAAGVTSAFMYPYSDGTRGTAQGLALAAGFSSALVIVPWAGADFRLDGPGGGLRTGSLALATLGLSSSTVMLFTSSPLVGEGGVSDPAFEAWAVGQGAASALSLLLMSWGTLQYGDARMSEEDAAAVRVTMMMRVLIPASGGSERPMVAGFMGRF